MFRAKGIHIKSRLDECKKFDEELKYRAIADKMMREVFTGKRQTTGIIRYKSDFPFKITVLGWKPRI